MELQITIMHMLIDVQDIIRLCLGGTGDKRDVCKGYCSMGSGGVVKNRKRQISIFAVRVCLRKTG